MRRSRIPHFRACVRELREIAPTVAPVRVRRRVMSGNDMGNTSAIFDDDGIRIQHFCITVDSRLSWEATWGTLIHEWAHAVVWKEGQDVHDHGPDWGIEYARIYRLFIEGSNADATQG